MLRILDTVQSATDRLLCMYKQVEYIPTLNFPIWEAFVRTPGTGTAT